MKLYLELLVLGIILLIVFLWAVWYNLTKKFYKWRYEKKYGTGKSIGGRIETRGSPELKEPINSNERLEQPAKRELLSTTDVDSTRENRSSTRKGFFFNRR
jgi:hypothetical protein